MYKFVINISMGRHNPMDEFWDGSHRTEVLEDALMFDTIEEASEYFKENFLYSDYKIVYDEYHTAKIYGNCTVQILTTEHFAI